MKSKRLVTKATKAEVTGGGIALEGTNTKTMELKEMKNIYVCGEIWDIFGRIKWV